MYVQEGVRCGPGSLPRLGSPGVAYPDPVDTVGVRGRPEGGVIYKDNSVKTLRRWKKGFLSMSVKGLNLKSGVH